MKNKFMSLEWFKNSAERAIERVVANKLESLMEDQGPEYDGAGFNTEDRAEEPLYKNLKLVNDTLTVVTSNGNVLSKSEATEEDYYAILNAKSFDDIFTVISTAKVSEERIAHEAEVKKMQALKKGIKLLADLPDFDVKGSSVYLAGTSRSLPQLLVEKFIEVVDNGGFPLEQCDLDIHEEYISLKRFFMWCCLNPRAEVANELYRFLSENGFKITKQGFFVALRNVVTLHGSPELVYFVSNAYNKVKAVWKKNPDDYTIFLEDGEYKLVHADKLTRTETHTTTTCPDCLGEGVYYDYDEDDDVYCENCDGTGEVEEYTHTEEWPVDHGQRIGGLTELYLDLPNREENRFTDNWTKTFDIRIGQVVNMPSEDCNWSTQDCAAAGLHFAGYTAPYVLCGDTTVMTLHNPMKVVGIGREKGRCWEYLPFMLTTVEEADQIMNDRSFDFLQLDEQYAIRELESLTEKTQLGFISEASKHEFNLPTLSSEELRKIVGSLEEMNKEISNRIVTID
jgi:hypothetical protein